MIGSGPTLPYHYESNGFVPASVDRVFAYIDDHTRLVSHMSEPSWKLAVGWIKTEIDEGRGQKLGSRTRLAGQVLGVELVVDELVTERDPPRRKVWETTGAPKLLVIGHYRMGVELSARGNGSTLRVFIDYAPPEMAPARWLWRLFGRHYARWRTQQMVDDAVKHFAAAVTQLGVDFMRHIAGPGSHPRRQPIVGALGTFAWVRLRLRRNASPPLRERLRSPVRRPCPGQRTCGDVPLPALVAATRALLLSPLLVPAIEHSGRP